MKHSLGEIAKAAGARLIGDGTREVSGIASIESATEDDVTFVEDERRLEEALQSGAGAIITGEFGAQARTAKFLTMGPARRLYRPGLCREQLCRCWCHGSRVG